MSEQRNDSSDPFDVVPPPAVGPRRFRPVEPRSTPETGLVETLVITFFVLVVTSAVVGLVVVLVFFAARH